MAPGSGWKTGDRVPGAGKTSKASGDDAAGARKAGKGGKGSRKGKGSGRQEEGGGVGWDAASWDSGWDQSWDDHSWKGEAGADQWDGGGASSRSAGGGGAAWRGGGSDGGRGTSERREERRRGDETADVAPAAAADAALGRSPLRGNAPTFEPGAQMQGCGGAAAGTGDFWSWPQQLPALPLWTEYADADGTPYYYNSRTGLTQWEKPPEMDPARSLGDRKATGTATPAAADAAASGAATRHGDLRDLDERSDHQRDHRGGAAGGVDRDRSSADGDRDSQDRSRRAQPGRSQDRRPDPGALPLGDADNRRNRRRKGEDKRKEASDFGPPGCNLFVFHLPDDWADEDLNEYFVPHGSIVSAKVMKELGTGRSRGFGFVSYEDRVSAATAIKKMQGYKILGKRLKVEFKKGEAEANREFEEDGRDDAFGMGGDSSRRSFPDDERLIGYLRAISAKNVVQSLKASEEGEGGGEAGGGDEDGEGRGNGQPSTPTSALAAASAACGNPTVGAFGGNPMGDGSDDDLH